MSKAAVAIVSGSERLRSALSALRHRNYRLYWFGQLSSVLAQNMEGVAQSWLVLDLTDSPLLLGFTGLSFAVPTIALTLLGGVIADRTDRRHIMILSQMHLRIYVFPARRSHRSRMGGALACHEPRFPFGLRARVR